ncbi:hypothetical protein FSP39_005200 [Pinctada imbricata]|uniref:TLC domain-containing protein n=1 Tax=Pinctada imbricata TaxID=66713 RepID=A0AA88XF53_PINIB|nr:hypothetical protein FSP39_005200 [Pinctada imbricata]
MNGVNANLTVKMALETKLEGGIGSIDTRHGYYMMFSSMLFFQLLNWTVARVGSPKSVREDPWRWKNLFISWFHALICGTWDLLCFVLYPEILDDLITTQNYFTYLMVPFSTGYFLYDSIDMYVNNKLISNWEVTLHHIAGNLDSNTFYVSWIPQAIYALAEYPGSDRIISGILKEIAAALLRDVKNRTVMAARRPVRTVSCVTVLVQFGSSFPAGGGGFSGEKDASPEISSLVNGVKGDIKKALACTNVAYSEPLTALKFRQQVVAGMNYIVSVRVGGAKVIHVKIYRDLKGNASLTGVQAEPGTDINPSADYAKCLIVS